MTKARTLGELKRTYPLEKLRRSVKDEARENLIAKLRAGERLFPGIQGYNDSVIPHLVNAILARHNFILLGLRGQAKSRILRQLTELLDDEVPALPTEIRDNPLFPLSAEAKRLLEEAGDEAPIVWIPRSERYVEKLATPDTTVADILGDIDPIKAAKRGTGLADLEAVHYGLLPRANRGIFGINEVADLAPKVQVALFNILQEGDVQIRGYPVRLRSTSGLPSPPTPRTTPPAARSSRPSKTASARRSAPTTPAPSRRAFPSPGRRPGSLERKGCTSPPTWPRLRKRWPLWPARTSGWTKPRGSRSASPLACWSW